VGRVLKLAGKGVLRVILRERLALAVNYVSLLEKLSSRVSDATALEDPVLRGAVERYLHLAVEALIDVGMRLCSLLRLRKPETYRDIARILRESGILGEEDSKRFELWIGFRNILVHGYAYLDAERLLQALREVGELRRIAEKLSSFIAEKNVDPGEERNNILERVKRVLEPRSFVVFAYVFGSRVHGRYSLKNDVDVAIYTEEPVSWRNLVDMLNALEDELKCRVDLVHLNTAPLTLAYEIISTGILVLDRRPEERVEYEVRVLREYLDLRPRLEEYLRSLLGA